MGSRKKSAVEVGIAVNEEDALHRTTYSPWDGELQRDDRPETSSELGRSLAHSLGFARTRDVFKLFAKNIGFLLHSVQHSKNMFVLLVKFSKNVVVDITTVQRKV